MRIILYSGKGGVGKTTVAAATGVRCAQLGMKTIVISLDIAHSLADAFDLDVNLLDRNKGRPIKIDKDLYIQEVDVQHEMENWWGEIHAYLAVLFKTSGFEATVAEELAIVPGMEEAVSLLYINQYANERTFDVIVLDCAPTGESLRFISLPQSLEWYMKKVFRLERNLVRLARPLAHAITDVPLPDDNYFKSVQALFRKLEGVNALLLDHKITSVRLVTNAEKMVIKETQRAYLYFSLFGMLVDAVIVNRLLPDGVEDEFFDTWKSQQETYTGQIHEIFSPVPIRHLPLLKGEVCGTDGLRQIADMLYQDIRPEKILFNERPYKFRKVGNGNYVLSIKLPFTGNKVVDLHKNVDELIVRIGGFKRHVPLPRRLGSLTPKGARFKGDSLLVYFGGEDEPKESKDAKSYRSRR